MRERWFKILKTAGHLSLSVLIFLAVLEIGVRVFHLSAPRLGQQDPVLGTGYIPGQRQINEHGVEIEIGAHGARGPTPSVDKKPGVFRVALLGDSFLQSETMPHDDVFHRVAARRLKRSGRRVELINFGVEGYSTVQQYLQFGHIVKRYRPDLVVLFFYVGNDLYENHPPREHRPGFRIENGELVYVPFEVKGGRRNAVRDFLRKHVRVYNYLPDLIRMRLEVAERKLARRELRDPAAEEKAQFEKMADAEATAYVLQHEPNHVRWRVTLELIERLNREVRASGGRLALAVIPTITQLYDRYYEIMKNEFQPGPTGRWDRFGPQKRLKSFARSHDILYVPLSETLAAEVAKSGRMLYLSGDYHFNRLGHELAGRALAESVARRQDPEP
jgi:lysophospholipase L1-like esterase